MLDRGAAGFGGWLALISLGLPPVSLPAALLWRFIEKPIPGLRRRFSFAARVRGVEGAADGRSSTSAKGA